VFTESRHVGVFVPQEPSVVYAFAAEPDNLPHWAAGLAAGIIREGERLFADSPMGRVEIVFAPRNEFGILDHEVTTPDGQRTYNPLRVVPADGGCEVIFSVRRGAMSIAELDRDAATVLADLEGLRDLVA